MKIDKLWMLLIILFLGSVGFTQPDSQLSVIDGQQLRGCFSGGFTGLPTNYFPAIRSPGNIEGITIPSDFDVVVNKNCLPNSNIFYAITNTGQCRPYYSSGNTTIRNTLRIKVDDIILTEIPFNYGTPQLITGSIKLSDYVEELSELSTVDLHTLKIVYCTAVTSSSIFGGTPSMYASCDTPLSEIEMLVLAQEDQFILKQVLETEVIPSCNNIPPLLQGVASCHYSSNANPGPKTIRYKFTDIRSEGNKIQLYGGAEVEAGASTPKDWHDVFSFSGGLTGGVNVTHDWTQIQSNVLDITHEVVIDPEEGQCAWASIQLNVNVVESTLISVNCTSLVPDGEIITSHELISFSFVECTGEQLPVDGCIEGCLPNISRIINGENFTGSGNAKGMQTDCTFDIIVTPCENLDHLEFYTWTYPNGTIIDGPGISQVPPGIYTLFVYDECGDNYELEIYVCADESYGDWEYQEEDGLICAPLVCNETECGPGYTTTECVVAEISEWLYDEDTGLFCQTISCPEGEACDGSFTTIEDCIEPTFGSWYYNKDTERCEREVLFNGDPTGYFDYSEPEYIYDYDDFTDECIRIVICGGSEVHEETEDPTSYGDWRVEDDFFDGVICLREVICFGDSDNNSGWEEEVNDDPEIEWEHIEFQDKCEGQVFCDGFGDNNPLEIEADAVYHNWDIPPFSLECTAEISCYYEGEEYETDLVYDEVETSLEGVDIVQTGDTYYCLIRKNCSIGDYYEFEDGLVAFYPLDANNIMCRVECQIDDDIYLDVLCEDLAPFTDDNGRLSFRSVEDQMAYNQMVVSYLGGKPVLSPNPVFDLLTIKYIPQVLKNGRIEVISITGQLMQQQLLDNDISTLQLDLSNLSKGLYIIRMIDSGNRQVYEEKVVKTN